MNNLDLEIQKSLRARHPILFLHSPEEDRVMRSLRRVAGPDRHGILAGKKRRRPRSDRDPTQGGLDPP